MKKKIAVMLMILAVVPCLAFAGVLQLGANAQLGFPMEQWEHLDTLEAKDVFALENLYYGPEMKLNLLFIDLDETLAMQYANDGFQMRNDLFADLYFKLLFMKISAGVGLQTQLMMNNEFIQYDGFMNMIDQSFMTYRAGIGFCLGPVEISAQYMVPGAAAIQSRDEFFKPDFQRSTFSLGLLFDIV